MQGLGRIEGYGRGSNQMNAVFSIVSVGHNYFDSKDTRKESGLDGN